MGQQKNTVFPGIHGPSLRASPPHARRAPEFLRIAKSAGIMDICYSRRFCRNKSLSAFSGVSLVTSAVPVLRPPSQGKADVKKENINRKTTEHK